MRWSCLLALGAIAACKGKPAARRDAGKTVDAVVAQAVRDAAADAPPKAARPEHAVWNLVDNRHTAHRSVDGELLLDARTASLARYAHFGIPAPRWHFGAQIGTERAALAEKIATLDVPIIPEQTTPTQITARVNAEGSKSALAVSVNGRAASKRAKVPLEAGWQVIAIPVDAGRFAPGENQISLETVGKKTKKLAFSWIRIGATHPSADQDPLAAATFDPKADALELAEHASLTWYVMIPEGAHLVGEIAGSCHIEVGARAGDASFVGGLLGSDQDRVDLSAIAGKVVRLSLTARDCPRARLVHPRITLHGPPPQPLPKADPPRFIVLWVMDALRADKIPIFTPGARAQTPNFDELAKTSAVFRQYYVQGNESQTSHSSIWTSTYPAVHGVRLAGQGGTWKIERSFEILGDLLTKAGLYTIGITANGFVNADGGYHRGFREYRNMMREGQAVIIFGEKVVDAAIARLDKHRDAPAFLFMGTIDNHYPWIARKPWIDTYSPNYKGPFKQFATGQDLGFRPNEMGCHNTPAAADIERLRAIYDSDVSYDDQQLGRFVAQLKSWGIWDQTMLIITSDHGDELFEDMRCGHGGSLRESLVRVPLLVRDPSRFPGGTIVDEGADGVDLLPTMLESLGQPLFDTAQGASLVPLAQGIGRGWPRPSYASMYEYAHAMRIGRWKMRVGNTGIPIVEDLLEDADETKDYAAIRPIERRMLTDNLGLFLALRTRWKKSEWGVVTNLTAAGAAALDEVAAP
ncbi:MAG TPA: sulfatase [Kofleriaceae bacterium]|nr:sulfatase [Kofleriaceae bacterium]